MRFVSVEAGTFPEVAVLNRNFSVASPKVRVHLETTLEQTILGEPRAVCITSFHPVLPTLAAHRCGCGTMAPDGGGLTSYSPADGIVRTNGRIDIAHYIEHMALDVLCRLGSQEELSGITLQAEESSNDFLIYVECDDARLGLFALNFALALMHQALYTGRPDPRYGAVLRLAHGLRGAGSRPAPPDAVAARLGMEPSLARFSLQTLEVLGFPGLPVQGAASSAPGEIGRVLVAEDNLLTRQMLAETLSGLGYSVSSVCDGASCLQALCDYRYAAVLLDIHLPDIDGIAIARWVLETQPSTNLVLMSGYIETDDGETFSNGSVRFLPKPFSPRQLDEALRMAHAYGAPDVKGPRACS